MDPATISLIIQGLVLAVKAAPQVIDLVKKTKDYIAALFAAGLISKDLQDRLHAHVDAVCAAALSGQEPPEFMVEPDPAGGTGRTVDTIPTGPSPLVSATPLIIPAPPASV